MAVLNDKWAAFIQGGVSIVASSCTPDRVPTLARVLGCRVTPSLQKVTIFIAASQAETLMNAIQSTGAIAAIFTQPSTHISVQLKGTDAAVGSVRPTDAQLSKSYIDAFVADVVPLGYSEDLIRALVASDPSDLVCITFSPAAAFLQTPGPRAGEPLRL
jgi:hypothetical protein